MQLVLVTDLDGTLWGRNGLCHPETVSCFRTFQKKKVEVLVATARKRRSAEEGLRKNGLVCPAVLLNGGIGVDFRTNTRFFSYAFAPKVVQSVLELLTSMGVPFNAYGVDEKHDFSSDSNKRVVERLATIAVHGLAHSTASYLEQKMAVTQAQTTLSLDVVSGLYTLLIQPANISKASGVQAFLVEYGLVGSRIVAVGNGLNDIKVFEIADLAVACRSSDSELLDRADIVIGDPEVGGWAELRNILRV